MKRLICILGVLGLTMLSCNSSKNGGLIVISPEEMQSLLQLEDIQLIDVRTKEEYDEGFIYGAQNIDYFSPTFSNDILALDKNKPVLVYCKKGGRSAKCSKKLIDAGFVKIYDLKGGISQWKHEGFKIESTL